VIKFKPIIQITRLIDYFNADLYLGLYIKFHQWCWTTSCMVTFRTSRRLFPLLILQILHTIIICLGISLSNLYRFVIKTETRTNITF